MPRLSQETDCLSVSLFMLHSSSQVRVCVGTRLVQWDDSSSSCVLAFPSCKHNCTLTASDLPHLYTTNPSWKLDLCSLCLKFFVTNKSWTTRAHISKSAELFLKHVDAKRPYAVCCGLTVGQTKQGSRNSPTVLPYGHWMHFRPARTSTTQ